MKTVNTAREDATSLRAEHQISITGPKYSETNLKHSKTKFDSAIKAITEFFKLPRFDSGNQVIFIVIRLFFRPC